MSISVSLAPVNTEVSVSSANDIAVSLTNPTTTVEVNNQAIALPQALGTGDSPTFSSVTADEFIGDLRGAVRFQAKAGENLTKGDVVYISGVSGQKPVVSKARANSATTMPAFGLANSTVNNNANLEVISFGTFAHGNTTGGAENWEIGDVLYISSTTAGALTNLKPSGESNLIQNIGKVERVHASSGSIMVAGAGRTAATPNLDEGKFFIGDSNNYSSTGSFNNQFINTNGTISLSNNIAISGTVNAAAYTGSQTIANYVTDTSITTTEFATYTGKKIIYTGGTGEIDLPAAVAADAGKSWVIINAGTGALTIDVDGSSTAQYVRFLTGGAVSTSNSVNRVIAAGGTAEIICITDGSVTNSASVPNYLIYGGGIS